MQRLFFKEEQYVTQLWVWAVVIVSMGAMIVISAIGFYKQLYLDEPWGTNPVSDAALLWIGGLELVFAIGLIVLIIKMKLVTIVKEDGFYYRYPPLILKERRIGRSEIEKFEIRKYKPIREYGGWGVRLGLRKAGRAYNVKGNIGMQLELKNNRRILFGTQRADALKRAMEKMTKEPG